MIDSATRKIDIHLHNNYAILTSELNGKKKQSKVLKETLEKRQFRFKYHTHSNPSKHGINYVVYDISWREVDESNVLVFRNS